MVGISAREQAERQWAKAKSPSPSGALWELVDEGEADTGRALDELRTSPGWTVLHDVPLPGGHRASLDHVVIGPSGVFVIESTSWSGEITVEDEELRAAGRSCADAVRDAAAAAQTLAVSLPDGPDAGLVHPVLCFVRDEWVSERIGDVLICSSQNVVAQLKTRRHVLDHTTVERLAAEMSSAMEPVEAETEQELSAGPDREPELVEPVTASEPERGPDPESTREPVPGPEQGAGRHGRARKRWLVRRSRIAQVVAGLGLLTAVAFRPDMLQPVGSFVSGMLVQEADANDGLSSTEPPTKSKPGRIHKTNGVENGKQSDKQSDKTDKQKVQRG